MATKGPSLIELCEAARARPLNRAVLRLDDAGRNAATRDIEYGLTDNGYVECPPFDYERWKSCGITSR